MSDQRVVVQLATGEEVQMPQDAQFVPAEQLADAYNMEVNYGSGVVGTTSSNTDGATVILTAAAHIGSGGVEDDIDVTGGDSTVEMLDNPDTIRVVHAGSALPMDVHRSGPTYIVRSVPAHKALAMGMKIATPSSSSQQPAAGQQRRHAPEDHSYMQLPHDHEYGASTSLPTFDTSQMSAGGASPAGQHQYRRVSQHNPQLQAKPDPQYAQQFPIIGDLEAYVEDEEAGTEAITTIPVSQYARQQTQQRYSMNQSADARVVSADGINITSYRPASVSRIVGTPNAASTPLIYRGVNKTEYSPIVYQPEFKVHGNTKYFRPSTGGQLIRIGNRTFVAMQEEEEPAYYPLGPNGLALNKPVPYATKSQLPPTAVPALRGGRHTTSRIRRVQAYSGSFSASPTVRQMPQGLASDLSSVPPMAAAPLITARTGPRVVRSMRQRPPTHVVTNHQLDGGANRSAANDEDEMMRALEREESAMKRDTSGGHFLEDVEKKYDQLLKRPLAGDKDTPAEQLRPELRGDPVPPENENETTDEDLDRYDDSIQAVIDKAMSGVLGAEIDAALHAAHTAASELMRQRAMERARDANPFRQKSRSTLAISPEMYKSRVDSIFDGIYDSSKFERRFADRLKIDDETQQAARQLESELYMTPGSPPQQYPQQIISPQRYGGSGASTTYASQRQQSRSIVHVPPSHVVTPQYHLRSPLPTTPLKQTNVPTSIPTIASPSPVKMQPSPINIMSTSLNVEHVLSDLSLSSSSADSDSDNSSNSSDTDTEGEWAGVEYVTRCICGLQHNDEFMIECDQCGVWQHCRCMAIDTKRVPENYLCERCKPRTLKLNAETARDTQQKKLTKWKRDKERRRQLKMKKREQKLKVRQKNREDKIKQRRLITEELPVGRVKMSDKYQFVLSNEYTDDASRFLQSQSDTRGANLLEGPSENICSVMYVAENVQGLVSSMTVPPNQPVAEYRGRVCTKGECNGRDKLGRILPYTLLYSGFTPAENLLASRFVSDGTLVVDARLKGSPARFARRSCRPNTQIKHVIKSGKVHFLLISTELIEETSEVTIPFDFDYRTARQALDCACVAAPPQMDYNDGQEGNDNEPEPHICPIREFNEQLKHLKEQSFYQKQVIREIENDSRQSERAAQKAASKAESLLRKKLNKKMVKEEKPEVKRGRPMKTGPTAVKAKPAPKPKPAPKKPIRSVSSVALKKAKGHAAKVATKKKAPQFKVKLGKAKPGKAKGRPPVKVSTRREVKVTPPKQKTSRRSRAESVGSENSVDINTKRENQMLKELRDYWNKDAGNEDEIEVAEERTSRTTREERKIQMMLEQFKKLEESERKKDDRRLSEEQPATRRGVRPGPKTKVVEKKGKKRRSTGKWKKGIQKKAVPKKPVKKQAKPSPKRSTRLRGDSETVDVEHVESDTSDEESDVSVTDNEDETEDRAQDTSQTQQLKPVSQARPPPRKRWASNAQSNTPGSPIASPSYSTRASGGSPQVAGDSLPRGAAETTTAKKRWLRQAIEEQQDEGARGAASPRHRSPIKKRRKEEEEETPMSNVEAAELLAQLQHGTAEEQEEREGPRTRRSAAVVVESIQDVHVSTLQPMEQEELLQGETHESMAIALEEREEKPQTRTRRKVTLDEYKKRKPADKGEGASSVQTKSRPNDKGFIPHLSEEQLAEGGGLRSYRLANLPDPSEIGRSSETLDDLKARIYGKRYATEQRATRSAVNAEETPPPPPPGPPPKRGYPESKEEQASRPSLEQRLRTEFGLQDDDTPPSSSAAAYDPSAGAAYPPPPLDPASFNAVYQQQKHGQGIEEHDDSPDSGADAPDDAVRRSARWTPKGRRFPERGRGHYYQPRGAPRW